MTIKFKLTFKLTCAGWVVLIDNKKAHDGVLTRKQANAWVAEYLALCGVPEEDQKLAFSDLFWHNETEVIGESRPE